MNNLIRVITWLLRITVGATFIISGFVKAVDPWGTLYKFEDYMAAMHLPVFHNLLLTGAFLLCAYEFVAGVFLLLGCFRKSAPIAAMLFMAVMLPLTVWIAFWNPVSDCGCFGDAFILSNQATLWKNVVLTIAVAWLIKYNHTERCLVRPSLQWLAFIGSSAYIIAVSLAGYIYQPLLDFRPYPVGTPITEFSSVSDDEDEKTDDEAIRFIYAKGGVEKSFGIDDELPDEADGWHFVRREEPEPTADADVKQKMNEPDETDSGKTAPNSSEEKNFRV